MLAALIVAVYAQTCAAMLPAPHLEYEWFRDGQPYAVDVLSRSTSTQRVYRRQLRGGGTAERVLSCAAHQGKTYLTERVGRAAPVRIPVALGEGAAQRVDGATVRRVGRPSGAAANTIWFSVSDPGISLYALRRGAGITEVRTPRPGGFSVLRAVVRDGRPAQRAAATADSMAQRLVELEARESRLLDSIAVLLERVPPSDSTVVQRPTNEFDAAIALIVRVQRRLERWGEVTGSTHGALEAVQRSVRQLVADCIAYRASLPAPERSTMRCSTDTR